MYLSPPAGLVGRRIHAKTPETVGDLLWALSDVILVGTWGVIENFRRLSLKSIGRLTWRGVIYTWYHGDRKRAYVSDPLEHARVVSRPDVYYCVPTAATSSLCTLLYVRSVLSSPCKHDRSEIFQSDRFLFWPHPFFESSAPSYDDRRDGLGDNRGCDKNLRRYTRRRTALVWVLEKSRERRDVDGK